MSWLRPSCHGCAPGASDAHQECGTADGVQKSRGVTRACHSLSSRFWGASSQDGVNSREAPFGLGPGPSWRADAIRVFIWALLRRHPLATKKPDSVPRVPRLRGRKGGISILQNEPRLSCWTTSCLTARSGEGSVGWCRGAGAKSGVVVPGSVSQGTNRLTAWLRHGADGEEGGMQAPTAPQAQAGSGSGLVVLDRQWAPLCGGNAAVTC